ncbi:GNAT family N-acetyltransferase [Microvirga sp. GCM10011540]|uniref:GNAT family N-acetyltransferase n=1 Tax=Microvirga sp. GCM10011540 TaxID=3317338 RepID=UPI00361A8F67
MRYREGPAERAGGIPAHVPVLETERLRLRGQTMADFPACEALWGDPETVRFIGNGTPSGREETWAKFLRNAGHWAMLGFGYWMVEEKATGAFIGLIGFSDLHREIEPPLPDAPEAGWVLSPKAHGKGYATEAVRAALAWGETRFGNPRSVCLIAPDNVASLRVAEKCGYAEFARATYKERPVVLLARGT